MSTIYLLSILCLSCIQYTQSRNVFIEVEVPWSKYITSPIVEVSEYMSQQQSKQKNSLFWNFVNSMCMQSTTIDKLVRRGDNQSMYEIESIAVHIASKLLPSESSTLFLETLQGLNTFSPSVEFYNTLSKKYGSPCGIGMF